MMREIKFRAWDGKRFADRADREFDLYSNGLMMGRSPDCVLMQYTGLKDKNGVEIYEGDVVQNLLNDGWVAEIIHCPTYNGWYYTWPAGSLQLAPKANKILEVIGNIYENPELLEKDT
jgi:hypothetical protein